MKANAIYQELFASSPDGILLIDAETQRVIEFNDAACRQLGYTREEFSGLRISDYEASETTEETDAHVHRTLREGKAEFDTLHRTKTGEIRHVHVWTKTVDLDGRVVFHVIFRDITERVHAENEWRETGTRLAVVLDNMTDGFFTLDRELRYTAINLSGATMVGRMPEQLIGRFLIDEFPEAANTPFVTTYRRVSETRKACVVADYYAPLDQWFEARVYPALGGVSVFFSDVTERRREEEALRASQAQLKLISDNVLDLVAQISVDGTFVYVSPSYETVLGYPPQRLIGTSAFAFVHPEDLERVQTAFAEAIQQGQGRAEFRYRHADGRYIWVDTLGKVFIDEAGARAGAVLSTRDITDRKQSEDQQRQSQERFRTIFEEAPLGMALMDSFTGCICEANLRFAEIVGRTRAEMATIDWMSITHPDDVQEDLSNMALLNAGKIPGFNMSKRYRRPDGSYVWVNMTIAPLAAEGTSSPLHMCMIEDITDRKRTEEAEVRLVAILEATPDLVSLTDPDGRLVYLNRAGRTMLGLDAAGDLTRYTLREFHRPASAHVVLTEGIPTAMRDGAWSGETELVALDGHAIAISQVILAHKKPDGTVAFLSTIARDITERRAAEESRRLQSAALHAAADAIVITDRSGTIEWVNSAFTQLTGYTAEEALGKNPRDLVKSGKHAPAFYKELWDRILAGHRWHGEMINRRKDGSLYTEDQSVTPILDASGAITHFVAIKEDITERLQLEAQFRQAQKMESVGQLTSGIAHDFNNLVTVINGMSDLVLAQLSQDDPARADVQEIQRAGERAATLTRQLLAFSRQQILEPRVMKVNTVVAGMESLLRRLLGEDIDLLIVSTPDVGSVKADPGQLEQVIINLAVNARDAMPQRGQLTIETENATIDEDYLRQPGEDVPPGSYVRLTVSDSGVGMNEATRARIFEPFFTTKGPGKGTGLGLSTVYGIVRQSQGFIGVYSEIGQGTSFRIYLPRVTEAVGTAGPAPAVVSTSGTETILLVEDNAGVRKLATRVLEPAGYTVLGAATGDEALRLLERHDAPVDLLLSDVVMPGMSGRHLAEQLAQTRPGMKVLYMSGYTNDTIVRHGVLEAQVPFLNKPFTAAVLLRKVREVLDA